MLKHVNQSGKKVPSSVTDSWINQDVTRNELEYSNNRQK